MKLPPRSTRRRGGGLAAVTAVGALTATLLAAVPATAAPPAAPAAPQAQQAQDQQAEVAADEFDVLVFSKTGGFRHDSIDEGIEAISQLGAENGFTVAATEDAAQFTTANLAQYEAVVFLSTTGEVLDDAQQAAFEQYIRDGGGYAGIHAASDTEYTWPWYGDLVGAYFQSHPAGTPTATVNVEDKTTPSSCFLPTDWVRTDEWYNFQSPENPVVNGGGLDYTPRDNADVNVIATVDESTYVENDGNATDDDHPIAWYQDFDGGRSWYTGGGHTAESFSDPLFTQHLLGGIQYAAEQAPTACAELPPTDADFEQVTLAKGVEKVGEPMALSVLPDGRVLHNARDGRIFLTDLAGTTDLVATVPVYQHDEDGLQSIAVDPDFEENGWVYLYYAPTLDTPAGDAPNTGTAADFAVWDGYNRLSRVKMVDDTLDLAGEQELLRVEADRGICCHAGGGIDFDAEGNLYLSTGDDTNPFASDGFVPLDERPNQNPAYDAQRTSSNTNDLRGKIVRITPDPVTATYTVPDGNLFPESEDTGRDLTRPEIYAMGFRNPFRMTVDKATGYVYLGEYGPDAGSANPNRGPGGIVEFNQVRAAGNFGWPYCTGPNTPSTTYNDYDFATGTSGAKFDCTAPVNESPNNTGLVDLPPAEAAWIHYDGGNVTYNGTTTTEFGSGGEGPMAGPVYNFDPELESDVKFPAYFDNHFFAGEWTRGWIRDIAMDAEGDVTTISPFFDASTLYAAMDMEFGPDGSLYVLDYGNGGYFTGNENSAVYKINHINDGARSPSAVATATPNSGPAPLPVTFSSEGSSDPDEGDSIVSYAWDFDSDGTVDSTEANPSFTYTEEGGYDARLTVEDSTGRTGTATAVVTVGNSRPVVEIQTPPDGGFFEFGDTVRVQVDVSDPDEEVDCADVEIDYILGHDSHGHPLSSATGCDVELTTVRDEGHDASANVFGVINVRYTDSGNVVDGVPALIGEDEVVLQPKRKQAEHFSTQEGVATETTTDPQGGAVNLSNIDDGDFVSYGPVSLQGIEELRLRVASAGAGGFLQAHLDAPDGPLVGAAEIPVTGGWQNWRTIALPVAPDTDRGTHELFLTFRGQSAGATGLYNLNFIDFAGPGVSLNSRPVVTAAATPAQGEAPLAVAFTGTAEDYDDDAMTYAWDFGVAGDADTADTLDATYTYAEPGDYTARLTATDPDGAVGTATVVVRVRAACGTEPVSPTDEFDGTSLDPCRWNAIVREDPTKYEVVDGELVITATPDDIYTNTNPAATANLVLQSADRAPEGDLAIETGLSTTFTDGYGQGGLLFYGDDDNYVKLVAIADADAGRVNRMELRSEVGGAIVDPLPELAAPANVSTYRLRLTQTPAGYVGEAAFDGGDWQSVGTVPNPTADMDFGVTTFGGSQPGRTTSFDYFRVNGGDVVEPPAVVPDTRITAGPPALTRSRQSTVRFTATGEGAGPDVTFECSLDGAAFAACTSPQVVRGLDDGRHTLRVRAVGEAGPDATPAARSWRVDATAPVVQGLSPRAGSAVKDRTPTLKVRARDAAGPLTRADLSVFVDGRKVKADGCRYQGSTKVLSCSSRQLSFGRHTVRVVAQDDAGNRTTESWSFRVVRR